MLLTMCSQPSGGTTMQDIVSSTICDLWAGDTNSYSGSGTTWKNLIASPADGSAQADNDFKVADLPTGNPITFSTDHFVTDGTNDACELLGAKTTFWNEIHQKKTGNSWWWAEYLDRSLSSTYYFLDNFGANGGNEGCGGRILSSGRLDFFQSDAGTSGTPSYISPNGLVTTGKKLLILSYDVDTATLNIFFDGVKTTTSFTFQNSTSTSTYKPCFGCYAPTYGYSYNFNDKLYGASYGNSFITDQEASDLKTFYETR